MNLERMNSRLTQAQIETWMNKRPVRVVEGGLIMTGPVRLSFPTLTADAKAKAKARSKIANPPDKYAAALLFPHRNIGVLMDALKAALRGYYPNVTDPSVMLNPRDKNAPVKDQGLKVSASDGGFDAVGKSYGGYVTGLPFINPKSGNAVPCFVAEAGRWKGLAIPDDIEKQFYGGCWVEAQITYFKSTTSANPGCALGLQGLWKLGDDNAFGTGGGGAAAEAGGDAGDAFSIEDPNAIMQSAGVEQNDWGDSSSSSQSDDPWG